MSLELVDSRRSQLKETTDLDPEPQPDRLFHIPPSRREEWPVLEKHQFHWLLVADEVAVRRSPAGKCSSTCSTPVCTFGPARAFPAKLPPTPPEPVSLPGFRRRPRRP